MFKTIRDLMKADTRFLFGFIVMVILVGLAIASLFSPYDVKVWNEVPKDKPPSLEHWLGTSSLGQDVFWKATRAIGNSLIIALTAAGLSRIIAVIVGLIAGYKGGTVDRVIMSVNDSFVVLPLLPVLLLIASILKGSLGTLGLGILLAIFGWAWDARQVRAQILSLRERGFTQTAIFSGSRTGRLVMKEHFPFVIPLLMATAINNMIFVIGMEIIIAVFGLSSLETPTIGTMIHWSVSYQAMLLGNWWWILTPVFTCIILIFALYMLSTSLSEFLDPRTRLQRIQAEEEA